jgi:hypothetical protein
MRHGLTYDTEWVARSDHLFWRVHRRAKHVWTQRGLRPSIACEEALNCVPKDWIFGTYGLESRSARGAVQLNELVKERARALP